MAEVALDFEDEAGRPAGGVVRLPGEELGGEGAHAGGGLAGADGPENGDAGEEAAFGEGEPFGPGGLPGVGGVVDLPDHERGGRIRRACGPGRQDAAPGQPAARWGVEPEAAHAGGDEQRSAGDDGGGHEKPPADDVVEDGVLKGDEVEDGDLTGRGKGPGEHGPGEANEAEDDGDDGSPGKSPPEGHFGVA